MMRRLTLAMFLWAMAGHAFAQDQRAGQVVGRIVDETGGVLPGVLVELRGGTGAPATAVSSEIGEYAFDAVTPGSYHLSFSMMNFSEARRDVHVAGTTRVDIVRGSAVVRGVQITNPPKSIEVRPALKAPGSPAQSAEYSTASIGVVIPRAQGSP